MQGFILNLSVKPSWMILFQLFSLPLTTIFHLDVTGNSLEVVYSSLLKKDSFQTRSKILNQNSLKFYQFLSVYLPASSHPIADVREVLDLLWAVCDTCFQDCPVFLLGDFNADLGDSVGPRGTYPVTARGPVWQKAHSLHFGQKTENISLL